MERNIILPRPCEGRGEAKRSGWRLLPILLLLTILLAAILCCPPPIVAQAETAGQADDESRHQSWTEAPPSREISPEEVSDLTGAALEKVRVLWSVEYSTETYPVTVRLRAPGLDGLPICVFEWMDGSWNLIGTGTAPELDVTVNRGGTISVATTGVGQKTSAKDADVGAPTTGEEGFPWLLTGAAVATLGIGLTLIIARREKL